MKKISKFLEELPSAIWTVFTSIIRKVRFSIWDYFGVEEAIKYTTNWGYIILLSIVLYIIIGGFYYKLTISVKPFVLSIFLLLSFFIIIPFNKKALIEYSNRKLESNSDRDIYIATKATKVVIAYHALMTYPDIRNIFNIFSRPEIYYSYVLKGYFDLFEKSIIPIALYGSRDELIIIQQITSKLNLFLELQLLPAIDKLYRGQRGEYRKVREELSQKMSDLIDMFVIHKTEVEKLDTAKPIAKF